MAGFDWDDLRYILPSSQPRQGGVLVSEIALADELGARCKP